MKYERDLPGKVSSLTRRQSLSPLDLEQGTGAHIRWYEPSAYTLAAYF